MLRPTQSIVGAAPIKNEKPQSKALCSTYSAPTKTASTSEEPLQKSLVREIIHRKAIVTIQEEEPVSFEQAIDIEGDEETKV